MRKHVKSNKFRYVSLRNLKNGALYPLKELHAFDVLKYILFTIRRMIRCYQVKISRMNAIEVRIQRVCTNESVVRRRRFTNTSEYALTKMCVIQSISKT